VKTAIKAFCCGGFGDGKTFHAGTYPKSIWFSTEPAGYETIEMHPELLKNTVRQAYYIPSPIEDIKEVFKRMEKDIILAHEQFAEGKVETLILDNMTYLIENRWIYINKYEREFTKSGELDTRSMYGKLTRWAYQFTLMCMCSFPGNVVVTSHIMLENEDAMRKKMGNDNVVPNVLGGFRNTVGGMFSLYMFLDKIVQKGGGYKYMARVDSSTTKKAKNRYNLDPVLENVTYQTITDAINKSKGGV